MSWPWMPVPRRLLSEERVLDLSHADRGMLLSLYLAADEHGRFEAGATALRRALGAFIAPGEMTEILDRLKSAGLVHTYEVEGSTYGVLDRFDQDITRDHRSKRPRPSHPAPPAATWEAAQIVGDYRKGQDEPIDNRPQHDQGSNDDRSLFDHGTDNERSAIGLYDKKRKEKRRNLPRGGADTLRRSRVGLGDFPAGCAEQVARWCEEMAQRRRETGGVLAATSTAEDTLTAHGAELMRLAEKPESLAGAIETMIDQGTGFGRGGPRDGIAYLRKIAVNWSAETKSKARARKRTKRGSDFVRIGEAPTMGPVDRTVDPDNELADVL